MKILRTIAIALAVLAALIRPASAQDPATAGAVAEAAVVVYGYLSAQEEKWEREKWQSNVDKKLDTIINGTRLIFHRLVELEVQLPKRIDEGFERSLTYGITGQKKSMTDVLNGIGDPKSAKPTDIALIKDLMVKVSTDGYTLQEYGFPAWPGPAAAFAVAHSGYLVVARVEPAQAAVHRSRAEQYRAYFRRAVDPNVATSLAWTRTQLLARAASLQTTLERFPSQGRATYFVQSFDGDCDRPRCGGTRYKVTVIPIVVTPEGRYTNGNLYDLHNPRDFASIPEFPGFPPVGVGEGDGGMTARVINFLNATLDERNDKLRKADQIRNDIISIEKIIAELDKIVAFSPPPARVIGPAIAPVNACEVKGTLCCTASGCSRAP